MGSSGMTNLKKLTRFVGWFVGLNPVYKPRTNLQTGFVASG
jgi:hypothetical protein